MRERSIGGVEDQEGKADLAEAMAKSIEDGLEVWMVQVGLAVEGSTDWKVEVEDVGCGLPA